MMAGVERMMGLASLAQQTPSRKATSRGFACSQSQALKPAVHRSVACADRLHREFQVVGFYLSAHPLDEYKAALEKIVQNWGEFSARSSVAPQQGGWQAPSQPSRSAKRAPATDGRREPFPTRRDSISCAVSEGLAQYRDMLEPAFVVITVSAEDRPEGINLRIQTVQSPRMRRAASRRRCASSCAMRRRSTRCASCEAGQ